MELHEGWGPLGVSRSPASRQDGKVCRTDPHPAIDEPLARLVPLRTAGYPFLGLG